VRSSLRVEQDGLVRVTGDRTLIFGRGIYRSVTLLRPLPDQPLGLALTAAGQPLLFHSPVDVRHQVRW
jgi:hypothetical protein